MRGYVCSRLLVRSSLTHFHRPRSSLCFNIRRRHNPTGRTFKSTWTFHAAPSGSAWTDLARHPARRVKRSGRIMPPPARRQTSGCSMRSPLTRSLQTTMISRRALTTLRRAPLSRALSSRASAVLSALDLHSGRELSGVYDGEWHGSGEVLQSVCPATGEVLARVQSVRAHLSAHLPCPTPGDALVAQRPRVHQTADVLTLACLTRVCNRPLPPNCKELLNALGRLTKSSAMSLHRSAVRF